MQAMVKAIVEMVLDGLKSGCRLPVPVDSQDPARPASAGGASKDILQSITHPRPADAFDLYRTPAWAARCEVVRKLAVELREGRVISLGLSGSAPVRGGGVEAGMNAVEG
jgi:hypothetical protein